MTNITVGNSKLIWSQIQSEWQRLPHEQQGEGSKKKIGYRVWAQQTDQAIPFEEWFREIVIMARTQRTHAVDTDDRAQATITDKYTSLAMQRDILPPDDVLGDAWGFAGGATLGSLRSRLKKRGFTFEAAPGGMIRVTSRPAAQQIELVQAPTDQQSADASAIRQDIARQNVLFADAVSKLETRINELVQINTEILRVMREVWQP